MYSTAVFFFFFNWYEIGPSFLLFFGNFPRACFFLKFDVMTNFLKTKDFLGVCFSKKGVFPATLLAQGEPEQVSEYCKNLIDNIGSGGGFILSSGCEVPLDANPENVAALIQSVRQA